MTTTNLSSLIDALGELKAQISELTRKESELKDTLFEAIGEGEAEGEKFRVSITMTERDTLDMAAVREHLSRQFIQAHTNTSKVRTVRVSARRRVAA